MSSFAIGVCVVLGVTVVMGAVLAGWVGTLARRRRDFASSPMGRGAVASCDDALVNQPVVLLGVIEATTKHVTTRSRWAGDPFGVSKPRSDLWLRSESGELVFLQGAYEIIAGSREPRSRMRIRSLTWFKPPVVQRSVARGEKVLVSGKLAWSRVATSGYRDNAGIWALVPTAADGSIEICAMESPVLGPVPVDHRLAGVWLSLGALAGVGFLIAAGTAGTTRGCGPWVFNESSCAAAPVCGRPAAEATAIDSGAVRDVVVYDDNNHLWQHAFCRGETMHGHYVAVRESGVVVAAGEFREGKQVGPLTYRNEWGYVAMAPDTMRPDPTLCGPRPPSAPPSARYSGCGLDQPEAIMMYPDCRRDWGYDKHCLFHPPSNFDFDWASSAVDEQYGSNDPMLLTTRSRSRRL